MQAAASKKLLRAEILTRRNTVSEDEAHAFALRIAELGEQIAIAQAAKVIGAYWPIKGEASPLPLLARLAARGLETALPVMVKHEGGLIFRRWRPGEALVDVKFGVREPAVDAPEVAPDIIFVPLVGFDRRGYRLGYGAGFYDKMLATLPTGHRARTVGIAYALQELAELPVEPHDQKLDCILTEREWIICQTGSAHAPPVHR